MQLNEQEQLMKELETSIERLQALYNQYFMGIERLEPTIPRKAVERKMAALRKMKFSSTALRFRFQTQIQKYNTQSTYWRRICRQIEEGTYERDIRRAKSRERKIDETQMAERALAELGDDMTMDPNPVIDLGNMMDGIDDPFGDGLSITDQIETISALASKSVDEIKQESRRPRDSVHPSRDAGELPAESRPSGIRIPVSSLIASQKMGGADRQGSMPPASSQGAQNRPSAPSDIEEEGLSSFFKRPSVVPPPPPPKAGSGMTAPPPPPAPPRPKPAPVSAPPRAAASNAGTSSGVDDARIKAVYRAYVAARKKTNESTENISLNKVASLLRKTEKSKGGVSDFKVVIRNGKAVIKTVKN